MIKPNSLYSRVVAFINSHNLGDTYTSEQFVDALYGATSHMKRRNNGQFYRVRVYQTYLKRIGMIQNVKRGTWQVNYHIPSWLTSSAVETIIGYKEGQYNYNIEKYVVADPAIRAKLVEKLKMYKMRIDKDGVQIDHEKEMKSRGFKVGATVKLIKTMSEIYDNSEYYLGEEKLVIGNTYTIHSLTDNLFNEGNAPVIYIKFHKHGYNHPYDCFEVFTHPKQRVNPEYKVGDLVEVTTDTYTSIVRGDILPVLKSHDCGVELKSEKNGNELFFSFEMVRLAPASLVVKDEPKIKAAPAPKKNKDKSIAPYIALGAVWIHSGDHTPVEYKVIETGDNNVKLEWTDSKGAKQSMTETHIYIQYHVNGDRLKLVDKGPKNFKVGDQFQTSIGISHIYTIASIIDSWVRVTWPTNLGGYAGYTIDQVDRYFSTGVWTKYTAPVKVEEPAKKMVECISATPKMSIKAGEIYTVIKEYTQNDHEFYDLEDNSGQKHVGFYKRRFKDVKEQVLCIDNNGPTCDQLTVGKIYDKLDGDKYNTEIRNDGGGREWYRATRFIKVQG